jgi:predicted nucleotidyltransferase
MATISTTIEQALENYLKDLAESYHLERVLLFGSYAEGTAQADSDIDLAIFSSDATDENRLEIMADCWLKTVPYKLDIQPVVYSTTDYEADNDFIQTEIIGKGIALPIPQKKDEEIGG